MIEHPFAGPHVRDSNSVGRTMGLVMLALTPATLYALYNFGWPAIFLFLVTVAASALFEAFSLKVAGKPIKPFLLDGSAVLTGWLIAATLPPWAPWWIGALGAFLAIVVGKHFFGGIGQNLFNPAMIARVALLVSFPLQMTSFLTPQPLGSATAPGLVDSLSITFGGEFEPGSESFDAVTSATILGHVRTELGRGVDLDSALADFYDPLQTGVGSVASSLGEASALLLLLGGLFLLYRRIISWHIPVAMLGTLFAMATLMHWIDPSRYPDGLYHVLSGAAVLGAFFIATDLVTSPVTARGQLLFGAGVGLLVYLIRTWAGYPEGVGFAVLFMNGCTPLIDHYLKPRIYGRDRKGEPLVYDDSAEKP